MSVTQLDFVKFWSLSESCMTISISNLSINNTAPTGTVIGVLTAQDASGTIIPCSFTLTKNSAGFFAISGNSLVTARAPILAGTYSVRVHANGTSVRFGSSCVFNISVNIAAPPPPPPPLQPVITVTPSTPTVPDTTPLGAVVATFSVAMNDGSLFGGTVGFGAPYYDAGGIFSISGSKIIVNPSGPGVGPNMSTVTDHITLVAIP
jgi:hypothetical protein